MISCDSPLYLHFLDRELGRAVNHIIDGPLAQRVLKCLTLATTSRLYCGLSLLWEGPAREKSVRQFCAQLIEQNVLDAASHHATFVEFIESRQELYRHDSDRYPLYFASSDTEDLPLQPTEYKIESTTTVLSNGLNAWFVPPPCSRLAPSEDLTAIDTTRSSVAKVLANRGRQAITYSLFLDSLSRLDRSQLLAGILQRKISELYTWHYMQYGTADIPTGIAGLRYFDLLEVNFPVFDYVLLFRILQYVGLDNIVAEPWQEHPEVWSNLQSWRGGIEHSAFRCQARVLLRSLYAVVSERHAGEGRTVGLYGHRAEIEAVLLASHRIPMCDDKAAAPIDWARALSRLMSLTNYLRRQKEFEQAMVTITEQDVSSKIDMLIVTATEIERDTVLEQMKKATGGESRLQFGKRKTYFDLGLLGGVRVALVQSEMGSGAPGASHSTVADACNELRVSTVVVVGIAFGVDLEKQSIGQVLVSKQLRPYEFQRVGTNAGGGMKIVARGDKVSASTRLLDRFRAATASWKGTKVVFGVVVSGEKLIDNVDFREEIKMLEPETVGGEMEGAGAYAAAHDRNCEWIVVKAICDWADGNKSNQKQKRQKLAAASAVEFVIHTIELGGFATRG